MKKTNRNMWSMSVGNTQPVAGLARHAFGLDVNQCQPGMAKLGVTARNVSGARFFNPCPFVLIDGQFSPQPAGPAGGWYETG